MYLAIKDFKPATVQILVTIDESDVILTRINKIIKSIEDLIQEEGGHLLPFDFHIDLSAQNAQYIKVTAIMTFTENSEKDGWILDDPSNLQALLHGLKLADNYIPLTTNINQSNCSKSKSWHLKCPISVQVKASTYAHKPLISIQTKGEEEVTVKGIDVNVMNGIVGGFQKVFHLGFIFIGYSCFKAEYKTRLVFWDFLFR